MAPSYFGFNHKTLKFVTLVLILTLKFSGVVSSTNSKGIGDPDPMNPYIIGGELVEDPTKFPFVVGIKNNSIFCTGTILSSTKVITAAHCCFESEGVQYNLTDMEVVAGCLDVGDSKCQFRKVQGITVHHDFNYTRMANDVAILELTNPLDFKDTVRPVSFIPNSMNPSNCTVVGWGCTNTDLINCDHNNLYKLDVDIVPVDKCTEMWGQGGLNVTLKEGQQLCAYKQNATTCYGDSGGPLICTVHGVDLTLVGVLSYGENKCEINLSLPNVFSDANGYLQWVMEVMGKDNKSHRAVVVVVVVSILLVFLILGLCAYCNRRFIRDCLQSRYRNCVNS